MIEYVVVIPARKGSHRIKNKNILKIKKKEIIKYTIEAARKIKKIKKIIVTTNDNKVVELCKKEKLEYFIRPDYISKSETSMEKTLLFTLTKTFGRKFYNKIKNVILLQPTSPLRNHLDIDKSIKIFKKKKYDSLFSAYKEKSFIWKYNKRLISFSYNYKFRKNTQKMTDTIFENGAIYIFNAKKFARFKNRLFGKIGIYFMSKIKSLDLDEKIDLMILKQTI